MAGMLPGVECARRRRFHQSTAKSDSPSTAGHGLTRRSSFCLYTSNHETHFSSTSSSQQRSMLKQAREDEKLGEIAREAKERLDDRLRSQRKSGTTRQSRRERSGEVQSEVFGSKRRFSWSNYLRWKATEEEECAVCLEELKAGDKLMNLPCAHRFHSSCLLPWLELHSICPCCRMTILSLP